MRQNEEKVICAAILFPNLSAELPNFDKEKVYHQPSNVEKGAIVLCGWRHGCIISQFWALTNKRVPETKSVQGFLTNHNRFLDRAEALELVRQNHQLEGDLIGGVLTSEDLW